MNKYTCEIWISSKSFFRNKWFDYEFNSNQTVIADNEKDVNEIISKQFETKIFKDFLRFEVRNITLQY